MLIRTGRRRRDAVERSMIGGRYLPKVPLRRMEGRYEKKFRSPPRPLSICFRKPVTREKHFPPLPPPPAEKFKTIKKIKKKAVTLVETRNPPSPILIFIYEEVVYIC